MKLQVRKNEWTPTREFLPLILGKELEKELDEKEVKKLELFEKGLARELRKEDSLQQAVIKMVKMALAAEFGPSLVAAAGAQRMIDTICRAILSDSQLRKQALIIIDRFTQQ
ncbi:MAG: hypothetical protein ACPL4K_01840 [Candidatus Margulisiibacteriota bacterium]